MKEKLLTYGAYTAIIATAIALLSLLFFAVRSDGAVSYCYITSTSVSEVPKAFYKLHGFRPWRTDNMMGIFESFDEAVKAAGLAQCPLRK